MAGDVIPCERRRTARRSPGAGEPVSRVRLRAGRELEVLDVSAGGALVEGETRLLPGTHVDVHIVTSDGRVLMRSRVVRAYVSAVQRDRIQYRGAVAFDRLVDVGAGYPVPRTPADAPAEAGSHYPAEAA